MTTSSSRQATVLTQDSVRRPALARVLASMMRTGQLLIIHLVFLTLSGLPKAYAETRFDNLGVPHTIMDFAGFRGTSDQTMAAQPFELGDNDSVTSATLALTRDGDPLGTMHVDLHGEDIEGNPSASLGRLGSIEAIEIDPYSGQVPVSNYSFDLPITGLTPNERYFIVLSKEGATNWRSTGRIPEGVGVIWSATDQQTGSNGADSPVVTFPEFPEWRVLHEDSDLPGGGPPFPVWFNVRVDAVTADFDGDGTLNASDIDLLSASIGGENNINFDPNGDDAMTSADRDYWIESLAGFTLGDTNLDGAVDFTDFLVLSDHFGTSGGWGQGDFDGNGLVEFPDFLTLAANFGAAGTGAAAAVPEPASVDLLLFAILSLAGWRGSR